MTNYREILRLHSLQLSKTKLATSYQCAWDTVAETLPRSVNCGLQWPLPEEVLGKQLSERLFPSSTSTPICKCWAVDEIMQVDRTGDTDAIIDADTCETIPAGPKSCPIRFWQTTSDREQVRFHAAFAMANLSELKIRPSL